MNATAVTVCTWGGLAPGTEETLTLGRRLSAACGAPLRWLVLGALPEQGMALAGRYGVARVDQIDDPRLAAFQPDVHVEALAQYCAQQPPTVLLLAQTFDGRLVAPRLAGRLRSAVVMNAVGVDVGAAGQLLVTASAYGGDTRVVYEVGGSGPHVLGVMANALRPEPCDGATSGPAVQDVQVALDGVTERARVVERATQEGPRLEDAQVIVAGGRGLGSPENFKLVEELAAALGGMAAGSRPIVDEGWVDPSRQVGLTGKITRPALYIAAGISGASQHMVGCAAAKTLVAINRDADAAVFRYARYGIVGNCLEILPELIRAVKER
ncbi:MAG: electron transfer flavoprotein subunit alpha/FixB family protein [Candidatus Binatia bacterium]